MKNIICLMIICSLLCCFTACTVPQNEVQTEPLLSETTPLTSETPTETQAETVPVTTNTEETTLPITFQYTVYVPNENADGFIEEVIEVHEVSPNSVLQELKNRDILPAEVEINGCSNDEGFITLDFNQAFADVVCSTGTSGELMIVGSVVNTYLSAFGADSLYFTVDGEVLESGHTVYDFVMSYFLSEDA